MNARRNQFVGKFINIFVILVTILSQFGWALSPAKAEDPNIAPEITQGEGPIAVSMDMNGSPTAFSLVLDASDPNVNDTLTWSISSGASNGLAGVPADPFNTGTSMGILYEPNLDYTGTDSFAVQVSDGTDIDNITVNVTIHETTFNCADDELGCVTIGPDDPVHIAYALTIEGENAFLGIDSRNGVEIAIDDAGGKILGHDIQFDGQNEGCSPEGGAAAGATLAADPSIVAVIGTSCSVAARAAMPLLSAAGISMVSPSNTLSDLTELGNVNNHPGYLRVSWNDQIQAIKAAHYAYYVLEARTAATLFISDSYAHSHVLQSIFAGKFKDLGGVITIQQTLDGFEVATAVANLAANPPDFIYMPVFIPVGGEIINAVRSYPVFDNTHLMGSDGLFDEEIVSLTGANVEGFLVSGLDSSQFDPLYENYFLPKYMEMMDYEPTAPYHAHAYDAFNLIKAAIEEVAVIDPDGTLHIGRQALRDALYATENFNGMTGTLTCSDTGDCSAENLGIFQYYPGSDQPFRIWPEPADPILLAWVEAVGSSTGLVKINGVDWTRPTSPFTWDWGDGSAPYEGWFPQEHTYADTAREYTVTITAHRTDGSTPSVSVPVRFNISNPHFNVRANWDQVETWEWDLDSTLTLKIYISGEESGDPDYITVAVVEETSSPWGDQRNYLNFDLSGEFDIQAGYLVTVSDGVRTKGHIVTELEFTDINLETDTVTGKGKPNSPVSIWACDNNGCYHRHTSTDDNGDWFADFARTGTGDDEQEIVDLKGGIWIDSKQWDEDGDGTMYGLNVPNPIVEANMLANRVQGRGWPMGATISLTINGNYIAETTFGQNPENPNDPNDLIALFYLHGLYTLKVGDEVTLTDGETVRTLAVSKLAVTDFDTSEDTVSGIAEPFAEMEVWVCDSWHCPTHRNVSADANGNWMIDLNPSDPDYIDITEGTNGGAKVFDETGNATWVDWKVPNPNFSARMTENQVHGYEWPIGADVTLFIDEDEIGTQEVGQADWDPNQTFVRFDLEDYDRTLQAGQEIELTDGNITKTHTVTNLVVTGVDAEADTVSGTAEAGSQVDVGHIRCDENGCYGFRREFADFSRNWTADFSEVGEDGDEQDIIDITPGMGSEARQCDKDGDCTQYGWNVPNPRIETSARDDWATGRDWPLDTIVNLTVDDPSVGTTFEYSRNATVMQNPNNTGDPNDIGAFFDMSGIDIQPGFILTASALGTTKDLQVSEQTFTDFDIKADTVSGHAEPDVDVSVWACDNNKCYHRHTHSDEFSGDWMVDFGNTGPGGDEQELVDIVPGIWIDSVVHDEDGDGTYYGENAPEPGYPVCSPGNSAAGTVFDGSGILRLQNVTVNFEDYVSGEILFTTTTDGYGRFGCSIPDGDYRVWADGSPYNLSREYYNESIYETATQVVVAEGSPQSGLNFQMDTPALPGILEHFTFNFDDPILAELAVRQAIAYGTDRNTIVSEAWLPNGTNGTLLDTYVQPGHWAQAVGGGVVSYEYSPETAKAILEAAGWTDSDLDGIRDKDGQPLSINFKIGSNHPARPITAQLFKDNMAAIGINVEVEVYPFPQLMDIVSNHRDFQLVEFGWGYSSDVNDEFTYPWELWDTGNEQNFGSYSNPAVDAETAAALAETTRAGKLPHLVAQQELLSQDLPFFPLFLRDVINTQLGSNLTIDPSRDVSVLFAEVTGVGNTTAFRVGINPADLPGGYKLIGSVQLVETSASFSTAQVCLAYQDIDVTEAQEELLRLFHYDGSNWVDVTDASSPDTTGNRVCSSALDNLSPFAVLLPDNPLPRYGGWVDEIGMRVVSNEDAISSIVAGEIDVFSSGLTSNKLAEIEEAGICKVQSYGVYYAYMFNPAVFSNPDQLNPFSNRKIREAMNWLVDRDHVNQEIFGGGALPKYFALTTQLVDYSRLIEEALSLEGYYAYDWAKANTIVASEMEDMGASLGGDGKWQFHGAPVVLSFLIRTDGDGTRLPMGNYFADQLENIGFTVIRQYGRSYELSPIWIQSDPTEGLWNLYTAGWGSGGLNRDEKSIFREFYLPTSPQGIPLFDYNVADPVFQQVGDDLANGNFTTFEERQNFMRQALPLSLQDSLQVFIVEPQSYGLHNCDLSVSADLSAGIDASRMMPYTLRFNQTEGGLVKWGVTGLFIDPPNPVDGSNWTFDWFWRNASSDAAVFNSPYTGLNLPQRLESAQVFIEADLPVVNSSDWVDLSFVAGGNPVPADVWIDWDVVNQEFNTVAEEYPGGLSAKVKVVLTFPADMFSSVFWQDGSTLSPADFVLPWIEKFELGTPGSAIYTELQAGVLDVFKANFRGIRFTSYDPLVVEYYTDTWEMDAENNVPNIWPTYGVAEASWHMVSVANLAEASGEITYNADKAGSLGVEWMNFVGGPSLEILNRYLDQAISENTIPYPNVLGSLISSGEATVRYANLKNWYNQHGHFWVGTGPYYLDSADFGSKRLVLKQNARFVDQADKWADYSDPKLAEVRFDDPGDIFTGEHITLDIRVEFASNPYPLDEIDHVSYLLFTADGSLFDSGNANPLEDGHFTVTIEGDTTAGLQAGTNKLIVIAVPKPVIKPTYATLEFEVQINNSGEVTIGTGGGSVTTESGNATLNVPPGALTGDVTFSITGGDNGYEITTSGGIVSVINSYTILPHGTVFDPPASLTFGWDDADDDGSVDGTEFSETQLVLVKDGEVVTPICAENQPACDMVANTLTVEVSSLSLFELGYLLNSPPVANAGEDLSGFEGDTFSLDASGSFDPDGEALSYAWDLDQDGEYDDAFGVTATVTFDDEGTYTVGLFVTDPFGFSDEDSVHITVANVAPSVGAISAPITPVKVATTINASASFQDPGADDFSAIWYWGDGDFSLGVIHEYQVTGSHAYTTPGVYTVMLSVSDGDGGTGTSVFQYIVIYDPNGGFVTGGGWITSPAGSIMANAGLTGKTTFGFESKYKQGEVTPSCNVEFHFKAADLKFKSSSCDWLIVSSALAQIKGTGNINGSGLYTFYLTAYDGQVTGGTGQDGFRFKIMDAGTGDVIYDNMPGAPGFDIPTTLLGGGSIVIHKPK